MQVEHGLTNSNVVLDYVYGAPDCENVKIKAVLQGPSEARMFTKQLASRAFIEVSLRGVDKTFQGMSQAGALQTEQL